MKTMMLAAAAMTLAAALNPASAEPNLSNRYAMPQVAAQPASSRSANVHYEWLTDYSRHGRYEGRWVLVR